MDKEFSQIQFLFLLHPLSPLLSLSCSLQTFFMSLSEALGAHWPLWWVVPPARTRLLLPSIPGAKQSGAGSAVWGQRGASPAGLLGSGLLGLRPGILHGPSVVCPYAQPSPLCEGHSVATGGRVCLPALCHRAPGPAGHDCPAFCP